MKRQSMVSSFLSVDYELPKDHFSCQHTVPQSSAPKTAAGSLLAETGSLCPLTAGSIQVR